ncbi:hypothetical protein JRQ81_006969, partial [Phrynocephalus forsythii]
SAAYPHGVLSEAHASLVLLSRRVESPTEEPSMGLWCGCGGSQRSNAASGAKQPAPLSERSALLLRRRGEQGVSRPPASIPGRFPPEKPASQPAMQRSEWNEQMELQELNSRLWQYVSRVRALEEENRRLAQELAALRGREQRAYRLREQEEEVAELRLAVAELSRAKGEAELERDALRRELARLEELGAQSVELRRRRLEPEVAEQRRQLEHLRADCAALEALLEHLRAEHGRLQRERQRRPSGRLPALLPPPAHARTVSPSRRDLEETCALVLSWSGEQSLQRYEAELRALQELEGRLGREDLQKLRAHHRQSRQQLQELHRRCWELGARAERLEQERLAQQERHGAALAEYQIIIDSLEEEKHFLTVSIAEYLKDYHELLQVKAGLSLEIATYRALLEGESIEWILLWAEEHGRKLPESVRNMLYEYSCRHSSYQQEKGKRSFPAIDYVDTQYRFPRTNISSSAVYSSHTKTGRIQTAAPGKRVIRDTFQPEYRPSLATKKDPSPVRSLTEQRETQTLASPYLISRKSEAQWGTEPQRSRREAGSTESFSKESTTVQKEASPSISEKVRKEDTATFSSYNLRSTSNQTKYERPIGGTQAANEKISDRKVVAKETSVLVEGRTEERLPKERTPSDIEKVNEKSTPIRRSAHVEQRTEMKQSTDEKKHTVEELSTGQNRKDDKFMEHKTPQGGNFIRWEEHIRTDVSEKHLPADSKVEEIHPFQNKNVSVTAPSKGPAEIPVHSEVHNRERTLRSDNIEITLQDVKLTVGNQKHESVFKSTGGSNQDGGSEEASSKMGTYVTESIAENIVSDIFKDFVPKSPDSRLPSATFEKKDVSVDEEVKTQTNIQDTVQDYLKASDHIDLVGFLKRDAKKVPEDHQRTLLKDVMEDTVDADVEGKLKRPVQVEIVEEPLVSTADERVEFSTPFEVEEAEDILPGMAGHPDFYEEGKPTTSTAEGLKEKRSSVIVSHVEEVAEGDDEVDEEKYYVSTPDEHPLGHEQDKNSVYGQIHIEEESTVKYSWQDEFLQGSQTKISESVGSPELVYQVMQGEAGAYISNEAPKEQVACAETIVIEKEIKIPQEFQDSIKDLLSQESKDPKQQLKEALEKLEDTLPESVKQELSALTKESEAESSTMEVDIRKVECTKEGGPVTIVAEVNLSQTLDPDQFNMEFLSEGVTDEIKWPTWSSKEDGLKEHGKQESESQNSGRKKVQVDVSSTPWTVGEFSSSAKLSDHDGTEHFSSKQVIYQGPVFKSTEASSGEDERLSQVSFDINRRIKQITIAPTEVHRMEHVLHEGPVAGGSQFGGEDFATSADVSPSVKEFQYGPEEIQTTETIILRGPVHKTVEVSGSERPTHTQFSADITSSEHISRGSKQVVEEVLFEGAASDFSSNNSSDAFIQMKGPTETSRSVRHIRIDPREVHSEHTVYEGHFPGVVELGSSGDHVMAQGSIRHIRIGQQETRMSEQTLYEESPTETTEPSPKDGVLDTSTTIRHINLSPKEFVTEQIVFTGPTSEQHLDSPRGSVRHIKLGQVGVQSDEHVYHSSVSGSSGVSSPGEDILEEGGTIEINRTTQHIRLRSSETPVEQIVFHGPVSETVWVSTAEPSPTDGPSESSRPVGHIKIGAKEASFTFQMDVTNVAGGGQEATILIPGKKEMKADSSEGHMKDGQKENESDQPSEELTFHQSVQLQRMVDQRSVVSEEKKIALLYLNEDEGEDDDGGPWF